MLHEFAQKARHLLITYFSNNWPIRYYTFKSAVLNDSTISCNGVKLDISSRAISDTVRGVILHGGYELEETEAVKHLDNSINIIELGSGIGYVSALIHQHTGSIAETICIEANPEIIPILDKTKRLNDCDFQIISSAYSADDCLTKLETHDDFWESTTEATDASGNTISVATISLGELVEEYNLGPFQLVCDIEGAERDLITNEMDILSEKCKLFIVEFHEQTVDEQDLCEQVIESGFQEVTSKNHVSVFQNKNI